MNNWIPVSSCFSLPCVLRTPTTTHISQKNLQPLHLVPNLKGPKFIHFCNQIWPQYSLDNQAKCVQLLAPQIPILSDIFTNTARDHEELKEIPHSLFLFSPLKAVRFCLLQSLSWSRTGRRQRLRPVVECTYSAHITCWFPLRRPLLMLVRISCFSCILLSTKFQGFQISESQSSTAASLYLLSSNLLLISLGSLACYVLQVGTYLSLWLLWPSKQVSGLLHPYRHLPFLLMPFLSLFVTSWACTL